MCNPLSIGTFALSAGSSLASYGSAKAAARARNRAKIRNYKLAVEAYHRDVLLANAEWKDSRTQTEINLDNLFQQTADQWQAQDAQIAAIWDQTKFDQFDILRKMLGSESAREQTGVSAMRIAGEPIRKAGFEITQRYQQAIQKADDAFLQKEIYENEANRQRRAEWHKTGRSPVPGFAPEPEPLEAVPGMGGTLLNIALAGVTSGISAFQIHKAGGLGNIFKSKTPPLEWGGANLGIASEIPAASNANLFALSPGQTYTPFNTSMNLGLNNSGTYMAGSFTPKYTSF